MGNGLEGSKSGHWKLVKGNLVNQKRDYNFQTRVGIVEIENWSIQGKLFNCQDLKIHCLILELGWMVIKREELDASYNSLGI